MTATVVSRRRFLAGSTAALGGLSIGFHIPFGMPAAAADTAPEINAWVVVKPDDTVVIRIARVEMGQGTLTGLAQLVAEELECDWSKVTTEYPTPGQNVARNRVWGNFQTAGSRGIRDSHEYVRRAGAAARIMLVEAAALEWNVPAAECSVANGVVTHRATGRTTDVRQGRRSGGHPRDAEGRAAEGSEGLDHRRQAGQAPRHGGQARRQADLQHGRDRAGHAQRRDQGLSGLRRQARELRRRQGPGDARSEARRAGRRHRGRRGRRHLVAGQDALEALPIVWDKGPNADLSSAAITEMLKEGLTASQAFVGNQLGDAKAAIAGAAKTVEAVYGFPYQHHVTMEPMNATAVWSDRRCEVWTATQNAEAALATAADAAGLPVGQCDVTRLNLGGGFGRRATSHDFVRQAVLIAKQMPGTPVKLIWSREEDMLHGRYHPVTMARLVGALDASGNLVGLHMRISGQSILAGVNPQGLQNGRDPATFQGLNASGTEGVFGYAIPNLLIDHAMRNPPVPPGFWRGVDNNQNALYLECFMDELALAAGQDPLAFRRRLLVDSRSTLPSSTPSPRRPAGARRRRPACSAGCRSTWATAAMSPPAPRCRSAMTARSRSGGSWRRPIRAMRSTRSRSRRRSRAPSPTACRRCCTARSPSRAGRSSRRTSIPIR